MESSGLAIYWRDYLTKRYGRNVSINIHRFYTEMDILFTNKRKSLLVTIQLGEENEYSIEKHSVKINELPTVRYGAGLDDLSASMKEVLAVVDKELGFKNPLQKTESNRDEVKFHDLVFRKEKVKE